MVDDAESGARADETSGLLSLGDLTAGDLARIASEAVLVLPVGATEQHGPCLPLRTDSCLIDAVLRSASARLDSCRTIVLAPTLAYGHSQHHLFAGAASLRPATLLAVLHDLIDSAHQSGFRRLFIANGHGGNDECIRLAVKDGANRHEMTLGACSYWDLAEDAWSERFAHIPGHAGAFEASLLLAAAPGLVRTDRFGSAVPGPAGLHHESIAPGVTVARAGDWEASGGYSDAPAGADGDLGRHVLDVLGANLAGLLERFAELPSTLRDRP
ncbi:MAG: creatininase family protein [Nocardioidaceae bacterium]